jgi:DNA-binding transcriptional ArsR family regulator
LAVMMYVRFPLSLRQVHVAGTTAPPPATDILADGEYSVSELEKIRGLPQPILSQQLARLRKDDLVETRRDGKKIYYSLASAEAREILEVVYDGFVRQT